MGELKHCKDCKFSSVRFFPGWAYLHSFHCGNLIVSGYKEEFLVTGRASDGIVCIIARGKDKPCGPDGKLWEAK